MLSDHTPFLLIISAPSGCGKTTLLKELFKIIDGLGISVSHTTRPPRDGEADGVDYHFVTPAGFSKMVDTGKFVEHASVHGNSYGTSCSSISQLLEDGLDVVLDIDVQGMSDVKASGQFDIVTIFILPPSMIELESRLRKRQTDTDEVINKRLDNAVDEISHSHLYDYIILNQDIAVASEKLAAIVLAERSRSSRTHLLNCE
jgi:guanylate kinase